MCLCMHEPRKSLYRAFSDGFARRGALTSDQARKPNENVEKYSPRPIPGIEFPLESLKLGISGVFIAVRDKLTTENNNTVNIVCRLRPNIAIEHLLKLYLLKRRVHRDVSTGPSLSTNQESFGG